MVRRADLANNSRWTIVRDVWQSVLGRDPTPQEFSLYSQLGTMALKGIADTMVIQEESELGEHRLINDANSNQKRFGVSLVSTYNRQCGISTYTENLYKDLKKLVPCCVLSDDTRDRNEISSENGVVKCWSSARDESYPHIIQEAIRARNSVVHIQHEYGLFPNQNLFRRMLVLLKLCGFKIVITMHTTLMDRYLDYILDAADVLILHSEWAAQALQGRGIHNTTVISHGTEQPMMFTREDSLKFVKEFIDISDGDILATSPGFISRNKLQVETLEAVRSACSRDKRLKFLLIGSTGRHSQDMEYLPKLKNMESDRIKVVQRFLSNEEMSKVLIASDFCVLGYEQTTFSISGISHLMMTHGVPTISSGSRILEDLDQSMSIKVDCTDVESFSSAILKLCNDINERKRLGESARIAGENTYWDKIARRHLTLYEIITENQ